MNYGNEPIGHWSEDRYYRFVIEFGKADEEGK